MALPDKQAYSALGGEIQDYQAVEDPTTDLSAEMSNELRSDNAAMTRTAIRAYVIFTVDNGSSTCTVQSHEAVWGNDISVKPTVDYSNNGEYFVTWPATVTDARGVTYALNLRCGFGNVDEAGFSTNVLRVAPNQFIVYTPSFSTGIPSDPINGQVHIFVL